MKTRSSQFRFCLTIILLAIIAVLLSISDSLPPTLISALSAQEKGGVVPNSTQPLKRRSQPRKNTPTKRTPTRSTSNSSAGSTPREAQCVAHSPTSGTGRVYSEDLNGIRLEMVEIPAGSFCMGSPDGVGYDSEHPQHRVTVQSFHMGKYEVTQAQWRMVMGTNPSHFKGDDLPVEQVSWNDAKEFCRRLSQMTGREYRLPSEAEWEYACRAGTTTLFAFGDLLSSEQVNFNGKSLSGRYTKTANDVYRLKTMPVGSYQPNAFGLYDMHGNVWEWCEDRYHDNYYGAPTDGSAWGSGVGQYRVRRGGSWENSANLQRSATRGKDGPALLVDSTDQGFRVAVSRPS